MMSNKPNPFLTIWTKPRWTFDQFFYKSQSDSLYGWPFLIIGIYAGLISSRDMELMLGINSSVWVKILASLLIILLATGGLILVLGKIQPWLMQKIGLLWNGKATINQLGTVNSFAQIPHSLIVTYQLIVLSLGIDSTLNPYYFVFSYIIQILVIRITIIGISKAQKFGYVFALMNWLLSFLPILLIQIWITIIRS